MTDEREEIGERQQCETIDVESSVPNKVNENSGRGSGSGSGDRGRGSGGRRGTLASLPGFGKILGQSEKEPRGGRRASTIYDISALGQTFAQLRGINTRALTLGDQKVIQFIFIIISIAKRCS